MAHPANTQVFAGLCAILRRGRSSRDRGIRDRSCCSNRIEEARDLDRHVLGLARQLGGGGEDLGGGGSSLTEAMVAESAQAERQGQENEQRCDEPCPDEDVDQHEGHRASFRALSSFNR